MRSCRSISTRTSRSKTWSGSWPNKNWFTFCSSRHRNWNIRKCSLKLRNQAKTSIFRRSTSSSIRCYRMLLIIHLKQLAIKNKILSHNSSRSLTKDVSNLHQIARVTNCQNTAWTTYSNCASKRPNKELSQRHQTHAVRSVSESVLLHSLS